MFAVIGAVLIWSASFVATKVAFRSFPPLTLGALRFIFAAILLGIYLYIQRGFVYPERTDLIYLTISGVLGITIYFSMENLGVNYATAADASLIVASYPALTMLLERLLYKVKGTWIRFFGVWLTIYGVYLIVHENSNLGGKHRLIGNIILLATGIVWAFYNFVTRKIVNKYYTLVITFYQTVAGAVAFIPLMLFEHKQWQMPSMNSIFALSYLVIFCSVLGFLLYAFGLKQLNSSTAVTLMNLVPVFGVLFSILLLHESVNFIQLLGGFIIIAGIIISIQQVKN